MPNHYPDRLFVIFNVSELSTIDFNQVYETSADAVRKSLDELETFADAINNNTKPIVTLHDGTEALRVATMIIDQF